MKRTHSYLATYTRRLGANNGTLPTISEPQQFLDMLQGFLRIRRTKMMMRRTKMMMRRTKMMMRRTKMMMKMMMK